MTTADTSTADATVPTAVPSRAPHSLGASVVLFTRQSLAGLRVLLGFTLLLGIGYPLAVTGVAQVAFDWRANGSLLTADGARAGSVDGSGGGPAVGSALIGQSFEGPEWFHPRPSVAGDGYDTLASAGSNLGPNNPDLLASVEERRAAVAAEEGIDPAEVPADALTASASGLDPDISPAYARLQIARVAQARGLTAAEVSSAVAAATSGRPLGLLGEPRVNVLRLNLALETMGS